MVNNESSLNNYIQATRTVKCYSLQYGYTYEILNEEKNPDLAINCKQKDFMFRRHCIVSNFGLKYKNTIKYIMFIDGDIGVLNPLYIIEDYLPKGEEEILFYDKIFNYEIHAGNYIMKNDFYTRNFLKFFADYNFKMPSNNDGSDNIALHTVLVDFIGSFKYNNEYKRCMEIYKSSVGYETNMIVVSCFRWILNRLDETPNDIDYYTYDKGKLKIIKKLSSKKWSRDPWSTNWYFCDKDFLQNAWKLKNIDESRHLFQTEFNPTNSLCESSNFLEAWDYNISLKVSCIQIKKGIKYWMRFADNEYFKNIMLSNVTNLELSK